MKRLFVAAAALCLSALASGQGIGRWVGTSNSDQIATGVASDSGALIGMTCTKSTGLCAWVLSVDIRCEAGNAYTMLINYGTGSSALTGVCEGESADKRLYKYNLTPSLDVMSAAMSGGGTIGVVAPIANGSFSVYRFDVDKAGTAITTLLEAFKRWAPNKGRDETL